MKQPMTANAAMTYATRRLRAGEAFEANRRDARILAAIGKASYGTRMMTAAPIHPLDHDGDGRKGGSRAGTGDDMQALRAKYQEIVGKRAFPGWDADELKRRMAEAE